MSGVARFTFGVWGGFGVCFGVWGCLGGWLGLGVFAVVGHVVLVKKGGGDASMCSGVYDHLPLDGWGAT